MANPKPEQRPADQHRDQPSGQKSGPVNFVEDAKPAPGEDSKRELPSRRGGEGGNPGNFANDRDKASDAGRKGGQSSRGGQGVDDR